MTAPVGQERVGEKWRITFLMPLQYTLEELPIPLDPNIGLKIIPGRLMGTIRYSGTWSKKNFQENETQLLAWIAQHGLKPVGEPFGLAITHRSHPGLCGATRCLYLSRGFSLKIFLE